MNSIPIINNTGVHFNIYNRIKTYMYNKYYGLKSIGFFPIPYCIRVNEFYFNFKMESSQGF